MTTNYKETGIDTDFTYISASDINYFPLEALNVTGRKVVMFGQNALTNTNVYPIGNLGNPFTFTYTSASVNEPKIDFDNVSLVAALPTGVIYQNRNYPYQTQIRAAFSLLENTPQKDSWLYAYGNRSYLSQIGSSSDWSVLSTGSQCQGSNFSIKNSGYMFAWGKNNFNQTGILGIATATLSSPVQLGYDTWKQVSCGYYHSNMIRSDGTLWGSGVLAYIGVSNGSASAITSPVQVGTLSDWSQLYCGRIHTLAIKNNGTLWAWGDNANGQLGLSDVVIRYSPVQVGTLSDWSQISCGSGYTMAIKNNGTLWSWGGGGASNGLGLNTTASILSPVQVGTLSNWSVVSCGLFHSIGVKTDGTLWGWGSSNLGTHGLNTNTSYLVPTQIGALNNWYHVSCGRYHSMASKTDGTMWAWGSNPQGQLGTSDLTTRSSPTQVVSITGAKLAACGYSDTRVLKQDGTLWSCGYSGSGRLGLVETGLPPTKLNYGI